ncbi:MAG: cytochrome c [Bacteroidetes bacterium]|jgi:mono/diheme cytochrome c family protein|nr:cytochrome c [Bacteroidota bacterium]
MRYFVQKFTLFLAGILVIYTASANEGKTLFTNYCSACHTVGKGRLVGPDLIGISENRPEEWLISFIQSSQSIINSGDDLAKQVFDDYNGLLMPDQPLSNDQVIKVLDFINNSGFNVVIEETAITDILDETSEENISEGMLLFSGKKKFANGGASCISCHNVRDDRIFSNGTLAKDLTDSYKIMGSAGLSAIISSPPFPAMSATYSDQPLTDEEVLNLTAYLQNVNQEHYYHYSSDFGVPFFALSFMLAMGLLFTIYALYYERKKKTVNKEILERQSPVLN